jgi:hypothetical protein
MDALQIIAPLVGVIVGGVITGLGGHLRARKERKRVIGMALAELLEVRHKLIANERVIKELMSFGEVGLGAIPSLRTQFESFFPVDAQLDERYNTAISLLAGIDPVLAFKMRSKNDLPRFLSQLRSKAANEKFDLEVLESLEILLRRTLTPNITKAVQQLARRHSIETAYKVKNLLKQSEQSLPEDVQFFGQLKQLLVDSTVAEKSAPKKTSSAAP